MEDLLATLKTEVEAKEAYNMNNAVLTRTPNQRPVNSAANSLVSNNETPMCVYCEGQHLIYSSSCVVIMSVKEQV